MSPRSSTTAADRGGRWGSTPTTLPRLPAPPVITSALRVIGCAEDRPTIPGRGQLQGDAPIQSDRSQSRWPGSTLQDEATRFSRADSLGVRPRLTAPTVPASPPVRCPPWTPGQFRAPSHQRRSVTPSRGVPFLTQPLESTRLRGSCEPGGPINIPRDHIVDGSSGEGLNLCGTGEQIVPEVRARGLARWSSPRTFPYLL